MRWRVRYKGRIGRVLGPKQNNWREYFESQLLLKSYLQDSHMVTESSDITLILVFPDIWLHLVWNDRLKANHKKELDGIRLPRNKVAFYKHSDCKS